MLSIVDLIQRKTLDIPLAAYLMARISKGSSFLVGASPGAAGKTNVMCALLNFLPISTKIITVSSRDILSDILTRASSENICCLAHEIGSGHFFAYLWGEELRLFIKCAKYGHIVVSNLHADNPAQTKFQIVKQNNTPLDMFYKINLLIYLELKKSESFNIQREIASVYESDGDKPHIKIAIRQGDKYLIKPFDDILNDEFTILCKTEIAKMVQESVTDIYQVRKRVFSFLDKNEKLIQSK